MMALLPLPLPLPPLIRNEQRDPYRDALLQWANEIAKKNCDLLWKYHQLPEAIYLDRAKTLIEKLIVSATERSAYVINKYFSDVQYRSIIAQYD